MHFLQFPHHRTGPPDSVIEVALKSSSKCRNRRSGQFSRLITNEKQEGQFPGRAISMSGEW